MPRFELSGTLYLPDPIVLTFAANQNFIPATYLALGYKYFDVIVIGAGGGAGGGIDSANTGNLIRSYGGGGGGGGLHRVQGLLSQLPATVPVVVGVGGARGNNHASNVSLVTDGGNGGFSSFNTNTAQASGGAGGFGVRANSTTVDPQGWGGSGGLGGRTAYGGGGSQGWTYANPSLTTPLTAMNGGDGAYANGIGAGGGGGGGGQGKYGAAPNLYLTSGAGGRGSYNSTDLSYYGSGQAIAVDGGLTSPFPAIIPGGGGGGKATLLNGLPTVYGSGKGYAAGDPGIVVLRLTAE
jgi:Glycine-rich domain